MRHQPASPDLLRPNRSTLFAHQRAVYPVHSRRFWCRNHFAAHSPGADRWLGRLLLASRLLGLLSTAFHLLREIAGYLR